MVVKLAFTMTLIASFKYFEKEELELSSRDGLAPFGVKLPGPAALVRLGLGQATKWVGCSPSIDWEDRQHNGGELECARG